MNQQAPTPTRDPMQSLRPDGPHALRCGATTRSGEPCKSWAMQGQSRCRMHGGSSPQARRKADERQAVRAALADIDATLAHEGFGQVEDPLAELGQLVAEASAFKRALAARVNALQSVSYSAPGAGTEQLRAELGLYERAMDRTARFLEVMIRSGFDERRIRVTEAQGQLLVGCIRRVLDRLELNDAQRALVVTVVPEELRATAELEASAS